MDFGGLGSGLAAMAFWGFIAAVSVAGIWDDVRKREAKHETLRRAIEKGSLNNEEVLQAIASLDRRNGGSVARDMKMAALWILPVAPGALMLGWALGYIAEPARMALIGVAGLTFCLGAGFWFGSGIAEKWVDRDAKDNSNSFGS